MQLIYKIFLVLFIIFIGASIYAIDWKMGILDEVNSSLLLSLAAGITGLILVFVLNSWSKLTFKR